MEAVSNNDVGKKVLLEDLSKEDLIKKCKSLLVLAQKAKQAKDALQEENDELKSKINSNFSKNDATTNEIIESLTQQKLLHVITIEELKQQNNILNNNLQKYVKDLNILEEKNNQLDNENVSLRRQTKRLTDENEQLLTHLDSLEKQIEECQRLGLEQQDQLLTLEKSKKLLEDVNAKLRDEQLNNQTPELQKMLSISLEEVKKLKTENAVIKEKMEDFKLNMNEKDKNILTISEELQSQTKLTEELKLQSFENNNELQLHNEELQKKIQILEERIRVQEESPVTNYVQDVGQTTAKLKEKLKFYHSKIVKLAVNIKTLKEDKQDILLLFRTYTNQIEEWKTQLTNTSQNLLECIDTFSRENTELQKENQVLKDNNAKYLEQLKAHKTDDEKTKDLIEIENIKSENKRLTEEVNRLMTLEELYQTQIEAKNVELLEMENIRNENVKLNEQISRLLVLEEEYNGYIDSRNNEAHEIHNIRRENAELKEEISRLLEVEKDCKIQIDILNKDISRCVILEEEYKSQIEVFLSERDVMISHINDLDDKHQKELRVYNDQSKKDNVEILNKIEENEKICIEYRKIISRLEEDINLNLREMDKIKQKNISLQEELEHSRNTEKQIADRTSEEILKLVKENTQLSEMNQKLQEVQKDLRENHCQTEKESQNSSDLEELVTSLKRENAELLTEMNEMNQALKERGETISKFQAHCEEVMKKLQIYESQANKNVDNISQKEELIKSLQEEIESLKKEKLEDKRNDVDALTVQKDIEISELKNEIENLKEKLNANLDVSYAESENMSTSTISRTEEVNRLKDLEGSWEERYGKLRSLAVKLKGKIRDLSAELLKEQNEKNDVQQKCTNNIKTISTLQAQCDKLEDNLDLCNKELKEYSTKLDLLAVETSKDKQKLANDDEIMSDLKRELEELKQEKLNTETWKKQISNKVQTFRKEREAHKVLKKEFEAKIAKLTSELEAKEDALKAESSYHQQTKTSLEHSNHERKKNSVLNLEMQDYERSVKELSQKLEKKQEQITKLQGQVDSQKSTANAIREQNKLLEERVEETKNEIILCQGEVTTNKKQIMELEEVVMQKDNKIQHQTQLLENVRSENEELSTELSKLVAEHQKVNNNLKSEKEHLRSQVLGLQQSLRETQDSLKLKQDELNIIQNDYENYKIRAQSVLRQNQTRDVGLEEKLSEELSTVKVKYENVLSELNECKLRLNALEKENKNLFQTKSEMFNKYQEAASEAEDLKILYDQLTNKYQQTVIENSETVRSLKVHAETLAQCYRQQLSEQEVRHNREIIELQSKIEKAPSPSESPFPTLPPMPREEGEGSESTETTNKSMHPVPLERLLGEDTDQEVAFLKKQLSEEESKVIHLTALLADTEQDLAKHAQMNKLLKEEIRRQQRSVEREKHAENLEYLKNVVFKFVTLHSGDERSRLVPVLNTILKLSPDETQKLSMVARGDPGIRGWTNYLPLWPSPSKP